MDTNPNTPDNNRPVPVQLAGFEPYEAAIEGWSPHPLGDTAAALHDCWPNSVAVTTTEAWPNTTDDQPYDEDEEYADGTARRQLVEIDTNYKPTRTSEHPVRLTRTQTIALAVHLLEATEDTFHNARVGRLRATEAAELLNALHEVAARGCGQMIRRQARRGQ